MTNLESIFKPKKLSKKDIDDALSSIFSSDYAGVVNFSGENNFFDDEDIKKLKQLSYKLNIKQDDLIYMIEPFDDSGITNIVMTHFQDYLYNEFQSHDGIYHWANNVKYFKWISNDYDDSAIIFFSKEELFKRLNLNEGFNDVFAPPSDEDMRKSILSGGYEKQFAYDYKTHMGKFKGKSEAYHRMAEEMNSDLDDIYLISGSKEVRIWNKILQIIHNFNFNTSEAPIVGKASDGTYFTFPDQKVAYFYRFKDFYNVPTTFRDMDFYFKEPSHIYFNNKYNNELIDAESRKRK